VINRNFQFAGHTKRKMVLIVCKKGEKGGENEENKETKGGGLYPTHWAGGEDSGLSVDQRKDRRSAASISGGKKHLDPSTSRNAEPKKRQISHP